MGRAKDQLIEHAEQERENLEHALDDIEAYGESIECYPSRESKNGERSVVVVTVTKGADGQPISREEVEQRRICGHLDAVQYPGDCNIVTSPFFGIGELREFETEQYMSNMMARNSP
ncbi:hypothetical protein H633G_11279 [Metarhizium anisopliae BRIP 53284]|nr:hypothetical protein H633G_11279 [Metarhizium anisopliae BRIP 53284]